MGYYWQVLIYNKNTIDIINTRFLKNEKLF